MVADAQSTGSSQLSTVVELIYNLCCNIPTWGILNLTKLITWLNVCGKEVITLNILKLYLLDFRLLERYTIF
jgi:hypothetical protein